MDLEQPEFDLAVEFTAERRRALIEFVENEVKGIEGSRERRGTEGLLVIMGELSQIEQFLQEEILPAPLKMAALAALKTHAFPEMLHASNFTLQDFHMDQSKIYARHMLVQLFPEETQGRIRDEQFDLLLSGASQGLLDAQDNIISIYFSLVCLVGLRPDRRAEVEQLLSWEKFISSPTAYSEKPPVLLIHPEWRERVMAMPDTKLWIKKALQALGKVEPRDHFGFSARYSNIALVLAPQAFINDQGVIRVQPLPKGVTQTPALPPRSTL